MSVSTTTSTNELNDRQIRKRIWLGAVPIMFTLDPSEPAEAHDPGPYFLSNKLREHFALSSAPMTEEVWFEYEKTALRWHYPVGVLFDLHADTIALPWNVVVRYRNFPANEILRCPNDDTVKQHYVNVLKEANYLKHGDGARVNSLSLDDSNGLWDGLVRGEFETFWRANEKLACATSEMSAVPLRLCRRNEPALQDRIPPLRDDGSERTLRDVLDALLPANFLSKVTNKLRSVDAPPPAVTITTASSSAAPAMTVTSAPSDEGDKSPSLLRLSPLRSLAKGFSTFSNMLATPTPSTRKLSDAPLPASTTPPSASATTTATMTATTTSTTTTASETGESLVEVIVQGVVPAAPDGFVYIVVRELSPPASSVSSSAPSPSLSSLSSSSSPLVTSAPATTAPAVSTSATQTP